MHWVSYYVLIGRVDWNQDSLLKLSLICSVMMRSSTTGTKIIYQTRLKVKLKFQKITLNWNFLLTAWLTDAFRQAYLITSKAMSMTFWLLTYLQPERCLLAYHSVHNGLVTLLTVKSIDLVVASLCYGNCLYFFFIVATLFIEVHFKQFLIRTAVQWAEHSWLQSVMDTSLFWYNLGTRHHNFLFDVECVGSPVNTFICKKA